MATTESFGIRFEYLKTHIGIIKICQEVINLVSIVCVLIEINSSRGNAFIACAVLSFIITALLILCNVGNLTKKFMLPWNQIEFGCSLFCIVFYMITSALIVCYTQLNGYILGAAFGFIAVFMYGANALLTFKIM